MSDDLSFCNMFDRKFVKNFSQQFKIQVNIRPAKNSTFQLNTDAVSVLGVLKLLPDSAVGPDCIPSILYKHLANLLAQPLSVISN